MPSGWHGLLAGRVVPDHPTACEQAVPPQATRLTKRLRYFYNGYPARDSDLYDNLGAEMTVEFARPAYYTVNGDLLGPEMRVAVRKLRRISVIRG